MHTEGVNHMNLSTKSIDILPAGAIIVNPIIATIGE
jgi:hypothetical protein